MRRLKQTDLERFELKLDKQENGCWIWMGAKSNRYGSFWFPNYPQVYSKDMVPAHKASYYLYNGIAVYFPDEVMHSCDNGFCCNPEHLSKGSHSDNMRDMVSKGRFISGKQVLNADDIVKARELRSSGMQVKDIAGMFGISSSQMSLVVSGCLPKGVIMNRKKPADEMKGNDEFETEESV